MVELQLAGGGGDDARAEEGDGQHLAQLDVDAECRLAVSHEGLDGVRGDGTDQARGREEQPAAHGGHEEADPAEGDGDPC